MSADTTDPRYDEARQRVEAKMGFLSHLTVFVVINVVFLIVAGTDWLWVTLFWGIGLIAHGWGVFFGTSNLVTEWKEKQIQKELGKDQPGSGSSPTSGAGPGTASGPGSNDPTTP